MKCSQVTNKVLNGDVNILFKLYTMKGKYIGQTKCFFFFSASAVISVVFLKETIRASDVVGKQTLEVHTRVMIVLGFSLQ